MTQEKFENAVRSYWAVRAAQAERQIAAGRTDAGTRGEATGGGHLDPMVSLVADLFTEAGVPPTAVRRRSGLELPGYFRPTKRWD